MGFPAARGMVKNGEHYNGFIPPFYAKLFSL